MKKIIYILALSLFIFNCSSDDDNSSTITTTFLEKFDGTVWKIQDIEGVFYRFNDNLNNPVEEWVACEPPSEEYMYLSARNFYFSPEIINAKDRISVMLPKVYQCDGTSYDFGCEIEFSDYSDEGVISMRVCSVSSGTRLIKTTIDVDKLTIIYP